MRYISIFSGVEAATVAWKPLGWEAIAFSEIDAFPSAVLQYHFPDVPNLGDITKIDWSDYAQGDKRPDLVVGGSPCQSFSYAGTRTGLAGASGLMFEYIRAIQELMPEWLLWENVTGALSSEGGQAFGQLLISLDELGYSLCWRVLDSQFFGVPQRRQRLFLVGRLGTRPPAEVLFEPDGLPWTYQSGKEKREEVTSSIRETVNPAHGCYGIAGNTVNRVPEHDKSHGCGYQEDLSYTLDCSSRHCVAYPICRAGLQTDASSGENFAPTLTAHGGKDPHVIAEPVVDKCCRRLTPLEYERLQGFPDNWTKIPYRGRSIEQCADAPRYRAMGNSMAVPVMRWIGERIERF